MEGKSRILLVEPDSANLALIMEILGEEYDLQSSASGEEALAMAPEFRPDLILLNLIMPGMDGFQTCRRLKDLPVLCGVKIILSSGGGMVLERYHGYKAGADEFMAKPFDEEELKAKVRAQLRMKNLEESDWFKTQFLSLLCDKTYTPLKSISEPIEDILDREDMDPTEQRELLGLVLERIVSLQYLIEKSLATGRVQFEGTEAGSIPSHAGSPNEGTEAGPIPSHSAPPRPRLKKM